MWSLLLILTISGHQYEFVIDHHLSIGDCYGELRAQKKSPTKDYNVTFECRKD